jgi:MFS family permease
MIERSLHCIADTFPRANYSAYLSGNPETFLYLFSEAACSPISVSLISDLYPGDGRSTATGIFHWGIYFGFGLSYIIGIYVPTANILGTGWRFCYYLAGVPGRMEFTKYQLMLKVCMTRFC